MAQLVDLQAVALVRLIEPAAHLRQLAMFLSEGLLGGHGELIVAWVMEGGKGDLCPRLQGMACIWLPSAR